MKKEVQKYVWSSQMAYAVGLITTDGSLSKDGRHIDITSKDVEQLEHAKACLDLSIKIGSKYSGNGNKSFRIQIGSVELYHFLQSIGLTPCKSKTIGTLRIPEQYFFDFLRGHFDGDGSFYFYKDTRWRSSYMYYMSFVSASKAHIDWLRGRVLSHAGIRGHITRASNSSLYQLKYAKRESDVLFKKMYYKKGVVSLSRKYLKIQRAFATLRTIYAKEARVAKR